MNRVQEMIDTAFKRWQHAEMKANGVKMPLACSSDVACAMPRHIKSTTPERARLHKRRTR